MARYGTVGTRIWAVQFGTAAYDSVEDVGVDANGDVFVLGWTDGTLPGSPVVNLGGSDLFLVKLDANGAILWTRMFGSAGDDFPEGLAITSTGDVYVTGFTEGVMTGVSAGGQDYFLGRYDTDGNLVMITQRGSAGNDRAKAVAVGPADNPYVVGDTDGDLQGVQAGNADIFVAKYDPAGTELWIDQRGTTDLDLGAGVAVNDNHEVFVVGSTALGLDGNVSAGAMDVVLIRYSTSGAWQYTVQRGSSSADTAAGVSLNRQRCADRRRQYVRDARRHRAGRLHRRIRDEAVTRRRLVVDAADRRGGLRRRGRHRRDEQRQHLRRGCLQLQHQRCRQSRLARSLRGELGRRGHGPLAEGRAAISGRQLRRHAVVGSGA